MPIDWKAHSIPISKRWNDKKKKEQSSDAAAEELVGTRYFLHVSFVIHFILQIVNAGLQHWETLMYFAYIGILYGPVLLFNLWIAQGFQQVMAKRIFRLRETSFDAVLSPMGGLTMHETTTVGQDVRVSLMLPWAYSVLCLFWIGWYALLDEGAFDKTLVDGVDFEELDNVWGLLANVAAQAFYVNVTLVSLHLLVPVFPLGGASFCAACFAGLGIGLRRTAICVDLFGSLISIVLLVVGVQQAFFHDQNGLGVFVLFNAVMLLGLCVKRSREPLEEHDLVTRSCYNEKEEITTNTPDASYSTDDRGMGEMSDLETVEIV